MSSEIHNMLSDNISALRRENAEQHKELMSEINRIRDSTAMLMQWKAKVLGVAASVSTLVSIGAWVVGRLL